MTIRPIRAYHGLSVWNIWNMFGTYGKTGKTMDIFRGVLKVFLACSFCLPSLSTHSHSRSNIHDSYPGISS